MKPGAGKGKGGKFERKVCGALSAWVSHGERSDLFWRSALSGGRATVANKKGIKNRTQGGDICSVGEAGHVLTNSFSLECKHVANLSIGTGLLQGVGPLAKFWKQACRDAVRARKHAILIVRQNNSPILVLGHPSSLEELCPFAEIIARSFRLGEDHREVSIVLFEDMVKTRFRMI